MLDMVQRSPLTTHFKNVHLIPFGLDTRAFLPDDAKQNSRRRLGIETDNLVLLLRASSWETKGLTHVIEALGQKPPSRPTTVLTLDERGLLKALAPEYRVIDLGWVNDDELYAIAFNACDVFLMPSLAESFGLMAVDAMAAGRPVLSFEGTALPATTHAPDCGIAVPKGDSNALRDALDRLVANPEELAARGHLARKIVAGEYARERYLDSLAGLYRSVLARRAKRAGISVN
jgi:glycosyltransferase involved in cell wall biosynthesis